MHTTLAATDTSLPAASGLTWVIFALIALTVFILDLFVLGRSNKKMTIGRSVWQTLFFQAMAALVCVFILVFTQFHAKGAGMFASSYISEWLMSIDNLFVISLLIAKFSVPKLKEQKVLFWGILISIVLRGGFIFGGVWVMKQFAFVGAIMGAWLVWTAFKAMRDEDKETDVSKSMSVRLVTKTVSKLHLHITTIGICILVIGVANLVFALDSIPIVLSITGSTFIAFSSNLMAVSGLRSVYFLFGKIGDKVSRLNQGVAVILAWIGVKMIIGNEQVMDWLHLPHHEFSTYSGLEVIAGILVVTVIASKIWPKKTGEIHLDDSTVEEREPADKA